MKHYLLPILLGTCLAAGLCACAAKTDIPASPAETAAPQTEAVTEAAAETAVETVTEAVSEAETGSLIGMANPMVPVDTMAFEEQLGFDIRGDQIDPDAKCFIINGKMAHITWTQKNVNNEDVEFVLRATKDAELAPAMHGIYDSRMSEPVTNEVPLSDTKTVSITFTEAQTEKYGIYTWKDGQIYYSLTFNKDMSQMALAEILDRVMDACRIRLHNEHVVPVGGITELKDCIVNARFDKNEITCSTPKEGGSGSVYRMNCECYEEELFDVVEIKLLQEGDTITVEDDQVIEIRSLKKDANGGDVVINGGIDSEDGLVLSPGEGGTYHVRGLDDCPSYHFLGRKEFELAKNVVLTDTADIENRCPEKKVEGDEAVVKHILENDYIDPPARGCRICLEGETITEIEISYVP